MRSLFTMPFRNAAEIVFRLSIKLRQIVKRRVSGVAL